MWYELIMLILGIVGSIITFLIFPKIERPMDSLMVFCIALGSVISILIGMPVISKLLELLIS